MIKLDVLLVIFYFYYYIGPGNREHNIYLHHSEPHPLLRSASTKSYLEAIGQNNIVTQHVKSATLQNAYTITHRVNFCCAEGTEIRSRVPSCPVADDDAVFDDFRWGQMPAKPDTTETTS